MVRKFFNFLSHGVWQIKVAKLSKVKAFWIRTLRFFILIGRGFAKRELQEKAAVLAYYTVVSIIPLFAFLLIISRSFLLEETFIQTLRKNFPGQEAILNNFLDFARSAIDATSQRVVAGLGIFIFLWATFKIINHLERSFNLLFRAKKERSFLRQMTDYLAIIFLCPVFLAITSLITVYLSTKSADFFNGQIILSEQISHLLYFTLNILSYLLISFLFTFLYLFLPNTRVNFSSAFFGGIVAGLLYQIFQWVYIYLQVFLTKTDPVLGTIAAIPFFLLWLNLSWLILLLGAKMTFAFQSIDAYEFMVENFTLNQKTRETLALIISHYCIKEFCLARPSPTAESISTRLSIPLFLTKSSLYELVESGVLSEVNHTQNDEIGYHPAMDVEHLTIKRILDMINENGDSIPITTTLETKKIQKTLHNFSVLIEKSPNNIALKNI